MKLSRLVLVLLVALFAVACNDGESGAENNFAEVVAVTAPQPAAAGETNAPAAPVTVVTGEQEPVVAPGAGVASLTADYPDALSIAGQLALGTLQLEETGLAITEDQAVALLPLWQAMQSLSASDTTAPAEIEAVVRQITETMTPAQITAIRDMALTADSIAEVDLGTGMGMGRQGGQGAGQAAGTGGGIPGTGAGGGMGRGLGAGAVATGEVDEATIATRQAERESGAFQEQALTFAVVRLLQTKTGQAPQDGAGSIATAILTAVSAETGLALEEIEADLAAGSSLVDIITAQGGNVDVVRGAAAAALGELENAAELDIEAIVERWFSPVGEN